MNESVWLLSAAELLRRTASADPTPGGGAIAAVAGALGVGLIQMAVAVTGDPGLDQHAARLAELAADVVPGADTDAHVFALVLSAYRMPQADDIARDARSREVERACIAATESPLALVATLIAAVEVSRELESGVQAGIVSDVLAGRDLVRGAARAAIRTADINIDTLDRLGSHMAQQLRSRRNALLSTLEETP